MPRFPVIQTQVADPARAARYSAPNVVPVQPQEPQQLQRLGQAMEQAGQQFSALAADRQRRIDLAAHTEREAAAKEIEIAKFSEFGKLEGRAAVDGFDSYMKEMEKRHEAAIRSAPAGPQREWLQQSLRQQRVQLLNSATSHRDKELRTWRIGGAAASAKQKEAAAIKMMDAEDRQSYINEAIAATMESAEVQGLSDSERNQMVKDSLARIHGESLRALVQTNRTGDAVTYFDRHRLDLDPTQRGDFEALVKRGAVRDVGYSLAAAVMQEAGGDEFKALERLEQERQAGKIDADTTAAAEARVRMLANDARAKRAEQTANVLTEGEAHILGGGLLSDRPELFEAARKSGVLPQLQRLERTYQSEPTPEQTRTYQMALAETLSMSDAELSRFTRQQIVVDYWGKLPKNELESLLSRRDAAERRVREGTSVGANVLSEDDLILKEFMHWRNPGERDPKRAVYGHEGQLWEFKKNLQEQINAERQGGRPVTSQRIRELAEGVGSDIVFLSDGGKPMPRLMLTDAEEMEAGASTATGRFVKLGAIEPAVAAEIARVLRSRGVNADFATVANEWEKIGMPKSVTEIKRREPK